MIRRHEHCVLTAYRNHPTEPWTIGWGNTYYENGEKVKPGDRITRHRADQLFGAILFRDFVPVVAKLLARPVNQNQFDALCSLAYNIGTEALKKSTLLKRVNAFPNDEDIRRQFLRWVMPGSKFEKGLTVRRKAEADLYFTPYQLPS